MCGTLEMQAKIKLKGAKVDVFDEIVNSIVRDYEDTEETETEIYGIKILCSDALGENHRSVMAPWIGSNLDRAESMRHMMVHTKGGLMTTTGWAKLQFQSDDWTPIAARIVRLAEIPF